MRLLSLTLVGMLTCGPLQAHELTPTYPKLSQSIYDGVIRTTLTLFNRREDIQYYKIEVYDKDWKKLPFASEVNIIQIDYLQRKTFDIYIRKTDAENMGYICTRSKILKGDESSVIASNICSKIK